MRGLRNQGEKNSFLGALEVTVIKQKLNVL